MKAQSSIEYLMLIGLLLFITLPLLYFSSSKANDEVRITQAEDAVSVLAKTADRVYLLGSGSKEYILISLPGGIASTSVSGNEISLNLDIFGGISNIFAITKANVTGYISAERGSYNIPVEMLDSGIVLIGNTTIECGNSICEANEDCSICSIDCGTCICGNSICEAVEDCNSCAADCGECQQGEICGNNDCEANEDCSICSADCGICPEQEGKALRDLGIDNGWYYKTNGNGLLTKDSEMKDIDDITNDLLDDNVNTPATTFVIRTNTVAGSAKYEGFIAKANNEAGNYGKVVLFGRVRIVDVDPFTLRVYAYNSDGNSPNVNNYQDFPISASILNEKVKWVELDATNITHIEDGFGFIKLRITALNLTVQDNQRFQFSELHIKVEE